MSAKHPKRKERPGVDGYGRTPLHYAATDSSAEQVRQLLASGIHPSAPDDDGWTPLHFAAQCNATEVATILLDAGALVDARDANGNTPLCRAVFNSRGDGAMIKLLRARGADPYAKNNHGVSALKLARTIANFDIRQFFGDLPEHSDG
jgi:ankyrin repeat protein